MLGRLTAAKVLPTYAKRTMKQVAEGAQAASTKNEAAPMSDKALDSLRPGGN